MNESFQSTIKVRAGVAFNQIYGGAKILSKLNDQTQKPNVLDLDQSLITNLADKLQEVLIRMDASKEHHLRKSNVETDMAQQGLRYLKANKIFEVSPFFHLSLMINSALLTADEVAANARLIL